MIGHLRIITICIVQLWHLNVAVFKNWLAEVVPEVVVPQKDIIAASTSIPFTLRTVKIFLRRGA